jgi:phosphatidate phosphatase APP1
VHRAADGTLQARIEAWVFERERNPTRTRLLARALGLDLDEVGAEDRQRFKQRAALFGADSKDGRELAVQLPGRDAVALPSSDEQGRVRAVVPLLQSEPGAGQWTAWTLISGARRFAGRAQWIGDEGISVVCDIDDTIKHTQVRQRRQMLLNTFAREFIAVPGMAAWSEGVARSNAGAAFHYVSGSPLQLLPPLVSFLRGNAFADGSLHLRSFSLRPSALLDDEATSRHKHAEIAQLLADHPRRRFVLVGDSGERDPEVYGEIAREQPSRIAAVLIRDVTNEPADAERYRAAFSGVAFERWRLFSDPVSLPLRWR